MTATAIRIGTRGSVLALAQARLVTDALAASGVAAELVVIRTEGDDRASDTAWGEGAFVTALERALIDGRVDAAVHSAKDMPTDEDRRLVIAAYLVRADPRDTLVLPHGRSAASLDSLPRGSRVGTDSPRRTGFLLAQRPDLHMHPLHGNVDTRLRRLDDGETDALVLAVAGLVRLGRGDRASLPLEPDVVPPAPGQGAIAVQSRADDERTLELLRAVDDRPTRLAVEAERAFLRLSGGGCRAPIGALGTVDASGFELLGGYALADGSAVAVERITARSDDAGAGTEGQGGALAAALVDRLTARLAAPVDADDQRPRVLVTRPRADATALMRALAFRGLGATCVPAIATEAPISTAPLDTAIAALRPGQLVAVTSANGVRHVSAAFVRTGRRLSEVRWAAVGRQTERALTDAGATDVWTPQTSSGAALAAEVPLTSGEPVLVARSDIADPRLVHALRARGAVVDDVVAYRTIEGPVSSRAPLREALADARMVGIVLASGSAVRGALALLEGEEQAALRSLPAICIGPQTEAEAGRLGFDVLAVAPSLDVEVVADLVAGSIRQPEGAPA